MNGGSTEGHDQSWHSGSDEATGKWLCFSVVPWMGQPLIKTHTPRPRPSAGSENTLCCTTTTHWSRSSDGFQTQTLTCSLGSGFFPKSGIISPTGRIHPYNLAVQLKLCICFALRHNSPSQIDHVIGFVKMAAVPKNRVCVWCWSAGTQKLCALTVRTIRVFKSTFTSSR